MVLRLRNISDRNLPCKQAPSTWAEPLAGRRDVKGPSKQSREKLLYEFTQSPKLGWSLQLSQHRYLSPESTCQNLLSSHFPHC